MSEESLKFFVQDDIRVSVGKSALPLPTFLTQNAKLIEVDTTALQQQLASVLGAVTKMLDELPAKDSGFIVDQFKLSLALNAKGELAIATVAKGELGATTTMEVTLRRA